MAQTRADANLPHFTFTSPTAPNSPSLRARRTPCPPLDVPPRPSSASRSSPASLASSLSPGTPRLPEQGWSSAAGPLSSPGFPAHESNMASYAWSPNKPLVSLDDIGGLRISTAASGQGSPRLSDRDVLSRLPRPTDALPELFWDNVDYGGTTVASETNGTGSILFSPAATWARAIGHDEPGWLRETSMRDRSGPPSPSSFSSRASPRSHRSSSSPQSHLSVPTSPNPSTGESGFSRTTSDVALHDRQAKLDRREAKVEEKSRDLSRRERLFKEANAALVKEQKKLEDERAAIRARERDFVIAEQDYAARRNKIASQEEAVMRKQASLDSILAKANEEVKEMRDQAAAADRNLERRERIVRDREAALGLVAQRQLSSIPEDTAAVEFEDGGIQDGGKKRERKERKDQLGGRESPASSGRSKKRSDKAGHGRKKDATLDGKGTKRQGSKKRGELEKKGHPERPPAGSPLRRFFQRMWESQPSRRPPTPEQVVLPVDPVHMIRSPRPFRAASSRPPSSRPPSSRPPTSVSSRASSPGRSEMKSTNSIMSVTTRIRQRVWR